MCNNPVPEGDNYFNGVGFIGWPFSIKIPWTRAFDWVAQWTQPWPLAEPEMNCRGDAEWQEPGPAVWRQDPSRGRAADPLSQSRPHSGPHFLLCKMRWALCNPRIPGLCRGISVVSQVFDFYFKPFIFKTVIKICTVKCVTYAHLAHWSQPPFCKPQTKTGLVIFLYFSTTPKSVFG